MTRFIAIFFALPLAKAKKRISIAIRAKNKNLSSTDLSTLQPFNKQLIKYRSADNVD